MTNLGWVAEARHVDANAATQAILSQHERIRAFMSQARAVAETALEGRASSADAVASAIGDIRATIEAHLAFEEQVLLPILRIDDILVGPGRAERLLEDHKNQRAMLAALHREACASPGLPLLAAKLAFLVSWLLKDMDEEEKALLK